jgi:hypothetical protein
LIPIPKTYQACAEHVNFHLLEFENTILDTATADAIGRVAIIGPAANIFGIQGDKMRLCHISELSNNEMSTSTRPFKGSQSVTILQSQCKVRPSDVSQSPGPSTGLASSIAYQEPLLKILV